ncbi:hypothetical protein SAMN03159406_02337 [Rhizobium sp. NFR03]|nr:hypothetical protein SAMN03159406_02337 [Rhizobium sp. NFR03]
MSRQTWMLHPEGMDWCPMYPYRRCRRRMFRYWMCPCWAGLRYQGRFHSPRRHRPIRLCLRLRPRWSCFRLTRCSCRFLRPTPLPYLYRGSSVHRRRLRLRHLLRCLHPSPQRPFRWFRCRNPHRSRSAQQPFRQDSKPARLLSDMISSSCLLPLRPALWPALTQDQPLLGQAVPKSWPYRRQGARTVGKRTCPRWTDRYWNRRGFRQKTRGRTGDPRRGDRDAAATATFLKSRSMSGSRLCRSFQAPKPSP